MDQKGEGQHRFRASDRAPAMRWSGLILSAVLAILILAACQPGADLEIDNQLDYGDAPDPTFPTGDHEDSPSGPAPAALDSEGAEVTGIVLGNCISAEESPRASDDCDDSQPTLHRIAGTFQVQIRRTDAASQGSYWLNVVADLNNDGSWDPDSEWVVRNCPVPTQGEPEGTLECDTTSTGLLSIERGYLRVMVTDVMAPQDGWDGSGFFEPGSALGEVEDHLYERSADYGDAPDPSFPTFPSTSAPSGPFVFFHSPQIGVGSCTTWEDSPAVPSDACDDGDPVFDPEWGVFGVDVSTVEGWIPRDMYLNVVLDLNADGVWQPMAEWIVRNCPVPESAQAPAVNFILCPLLASAQLFGNLPSDSPVWYRILLSEVELDEPAGWRGEGDPAGYSFGEVEDGTYRRDDENPRLPLPTPTMPVVTAPERPTTQPEIGVGRNIDAPDDVQFMDDAGNLVGSAPAGHPADILEVQAMWVTEGEERYLEIWVFRAKCERGYSSAVQFFLFVDDFSSPALGGFWQDHASQITQQFFGPEGELRNPGIGVEVNGNGMQVHFKIPEELVGDANRLLVRSFDRPSETEDQYRGFDETDLLQLPLE